jgi:FdrA protein
MTDTPAIPPTQTPAPADRLLTAPVRVINVGLEGFADDLRAQGVPVTHVAWSPPAGGDERLAALLAKLGM